MGVYSKFVLPHLIDLVMKDEETAKQRAKLIPRAAGGRAQHRDRLGFKPSILRSDGHPARRRGPFAGTAADGTRAGGLSFALESPERSAESLPFAEAGMDTVAVA